MKKRVMVLLAAVLLLGCGRTGREAVQQTTVPVESALPTAAAQSGTLSVQKVEDLPDGFVLGMDASSVLAEEQSGVRYLNFAGEEQDVFLTLAENGITHIRVRVWNCPYDADGHGYGGGNCDVETAVTIGKRAAQYGLQLIVDFHYSDFWADPGKQQAPLAWRDYSMAQKTDALYAFTFDALTQMKTAGVPVAMVQVGNETNGGLCGETDWANITTLMQTGSAAVRAVFPHALVAVHFTNPEQSGALLWYAETLANCAVDYDVFATSYYPVWHGTLENLASVLNAVAAQYGKQVMVMETSYPYTPDDTDFFANTISGTTTGIAAPYPFTVQGQADCVRDVVDTVAHVQNGIGVVYWEGAWISVGTRSWEENREKWEAYGSGWATSYAGSYEPTDAGNNFGGNAVDNQAMFDETGRPLESLRIWDLIRTGN